MPLFGRSGPRARNASGLRLVLLVFALAAAAACGSSPTGPPPVTQPPPPPDPPKPPAPPTLDVARILAFGDSMTEGIDQPPLAHPVFGWTLPQGAGRSQSYPFKFKAMADERYTSQTIAVFNGGLAGRQAREDRERFGQALSEGQPQVVLLMEGANDLNGPLAAGEGINARVTSVVDALEDMVRDATARGISVFIATLPPQRPGGPKAGGVDYLPRFNDSLKTMAQKKGATLVDVNAQLPLAFIGADGLHPTEEGYKRIAEIWFEPIKARYERAPQ